MHSPDVPLHVFGASAALFGFKVQRADPAPARQPELAAIEAAIGDLLLGTGTIEAVARRHRLDARALAELFERYRRGGRMAEAMTCPSGHVRTARRARACYRHGLG